MKILQCARCGAPLEAKFFGRRIKCNYCGATNEEEKLQTLHKEKPKDFSPPKKWTPPKSAPIESREPLPYKRDLGDWFAIIYVPALILLFAGGAAWDKWGGNFYGVLPADLARLNVVGSPESVGKELQGAHVTKDGVTADFRTGSAAPFKSLRFDWSESHMTAPQWLVIEPIDSKAKPSADVEARLSSALPGGLSAQSDWKFGAVFVQFRKDVGGEIDISVDPHPHDDNNPLAARQAAVAMRVLANAAFGQPLDVDPNEMREVFGGGYPVASMLQLDPTTRVANARAVMKRLFSGAFVHANSFDVSLDHPLLSRATVKWDDDDEHGGRMRNVTFDVTSAFSGRRDSFVTCLAKTLGPVKKSTPRKGAPDYRFDLAAYPEEASFELLANGVVDMHAFDLFPASKWHDVFTAIETCR